MLFLVIQLHASCYFSLDPPCVFGPSMCCQPKDSAAAAMQPGPHSAEFLARRRGTDLCATSQEHTLVVIPSLIPSSSIIALICFPLTGSHDFLVLSHLLTLAFRGWRWLTRLLICHISSDFLPHDLQSPTPSRKMTGD
jgi:hypothetical protein